MHLQQGWIDKKKTHRITHLHDLALKCLIFNLQFSPFVCETRSVLFRKLIVTREHHILSIKTTVSQVALQVLMRQKMTGVIDFAANCSVTKIIYELHPSV